VRDAVARGERTGAATACTGRTTRERRHPDRGRGDGHERGLARARRQVQDVVPRPRRAEAGPPSRRTSSTAPPPSSGVGLPPELFPSVFAPPAMPAGPPTRSSRSDGEAHPAGHALPDRRSATPPEPGSGGHYLAQHAPQSGASWRLWGSRGALGPADAGGVSRPSNPWAARMRQSFQRAGVRPFLFDEAVTLTRQRHELRRLIRGGRGP
jgi:hypothetical protein